MARWTTLQDLYEFWPDLASVGPYTDETLRHHIDRCEEIVLADLASVGLTGPWDDPTSQTSLRRLTCLKTLADVLTFPVGERAFEAAGVRIAEAFETRYERELDRLIQRKERLKGGRRIQNVPCFLTREDGRFRRL